MQTELYQHYLQKLGLTLWLPNDFVLPDVADSSVVSLEAVAPSEKTLIAKPLPSIEVNPVSQFASAGESNALKTAINKASVLPAVCALKLIDNARLTVIASPGNDPRSNARQANDNLLDNMLYAIGITNEHYSLVQVAREQDNNSQTLNGKVLWVCGQLAASLLFNRPVVLASMRGKIHQVGEHKIVVSYHPDELRKNPALKKMAWQDLRLLALVLNQ